VPNCKSFLVTEAKRKHVRRRASLVAVACFLPGRAKDISAPLYNRTPVLYRLKNFTHKLSVVQIFVENDLEMLKKHISGSFSFGGRGALNEK